MNYPKAEIKPVPIKPHVVGKQLSDLSVVAYYPKYWDIKPDPTDEAFWSGDMLRALIPLLGNVTFAEVDSGIIEDNKGYFDPLDDVSFDIGWEVCARPKRKIAKWVFGMVSDFVGREDAMDKWMADGHLDAVFTLRCVSQRLREQCAKYKLPLYSFPYFVVGERPYNADKNIDAAMIGTRGKGYNWRQKMYPVLAKMSNAYEMLLHEAGGKNGRIPYTEYMETMGRIKYFFSGGVDDGDWDTAQIPAKHIEACAAGACLVSPTLPMMDSCGFIDGVNFIQLNNVNEIPDILSSDAWREISKAGYKLINERHSVEARAQQILETCYGKADSSLCLS